MGKNGQAISGKVVKVVGHNQELLFVVGFARYPNAFLYRYILNFTDFNL